MAKMNVIPANVEITLVIFYFLLHQTLKDTSKN